MGQTLEDGIDILTVGRIQVSGGFVRQENFGVHAQGASDGHPLLLTAGEHGGITAQHGLGQSYFFYQNLSLFPCLLGACPPQLHGVHHIFCHCEQRK